MSRLPSRTRWLWQSVPESLMRILMKIKVVGWPGLTGGIVLIEGGG